jgi:hypothetical protein
MLSRGNLRQTGYFFIIARVIAVMELLVDGWFRLALEGGGRWLSLTRW